MLTLNRQHVSLVIATNPLDINSKKNIVLNPNSFKQHVMLSLNTLYGEIGSSIDVNLFKYNQFERRGILKVHKDYYIRLYSALTLNGLYDDIECAYRIHKTTRNHIDFDLDNPSDQED